MTCCQRAVAAVASTLLCLAAGAVHADAVSEMLIFLEDDGEHYLAQRTIRSDAPSHHFHVDKALTLEQLGYIDPNEFTWDDKGAESNVLNFEQGSFTVMYPGRWNDQELSREADGTYVYRSWDGRTREDGHFGMWHDPGKFSRFNYAWIYPEHFEVVGYESNRDGEWVQRGNSLTFFAEDVNDLTFTIRFRERDGDGDGVADRADRCPGTAPGVTVDAQGCEPDSDQDGVLDRDDKCPDTAAGRAVDGAGCEPDRDGDGVPDLRDLCGKTRAGASVDADGCEADADGDGVVDAQDQCPDTPAETAVDAAGCEFDHDQDGVVDRLDLCGATPAEAKVDAKGCEPDRDGDRLIDRLDRCPDSAPGAVVDADGCEIDCDGDGVVNSQDRCPHTVFGRAVDSTGCELDGDGDGVVDALDHCPGTPAGRAVDEVGCELDDDGDGVRNAADLCPGTPPGTAVDVTGCPQQTAIRLEGVNFHTDSDALTDDSLAILDRVAETLLEHPELSLEIAGHTDAEGTAEYNLDLSQRRAQTVLRYLTDKGVRLRTLIAKGYGEEQPVAGNDSAEGRALNRRVELRRLDD